MSLTITVPKDYGYVFATATLTTIIASYHTLMVGRYRRAAKVPYPNAYASAAECKESKEKYLFNCAQRSHANLLEHQPQMLVGLLIGGLKYPLVSACVGTAWCVSRVAYTLGYTRKDKSDGSGRHIGGVSNLFELALIIMGGMTGYEMIMG